MSSLPTNGPSAETPSADTAGTGSDHTEPDHGAVGAPGAAGEIVWLSTKAAAARLGVAPRTLYRFVDGGDLPAYKFGRVIRLKQHDIDAYIESCRVAPGSMRHLYGETDNDPDTDG